MRPDHLYKYVSLRSPDEKTQQRRDALLSTPKLWFSAPSSFNDPMDCKPGFRFDGGTPKERERLHKTILLRLIREEHGDGIGNKRDTLLAEYLTRYPSLDEALLEIGHTLLSKDLQSDVGVLCLSECERDPVMFYHYGDKHKGVCLQFRTEQYFSWAEPLQYSEDYPVINFFGDGDNRKQFEQIFLTKYAGWSYEHEWRVIDFKQDPNRRFQEYTAELLEGVIFGYLMPEEDRQYATNLLEQRGHPVKLYEAKVSREHYLLDISPCGETTPSS